MVLNFSVANVVARLFPPPDESVQRLIEEIRVPRGAGEAHEISA
jgi:cation/acetate symporter